MTTNKDLQVTLFKELRQMRKDAIRLNGNVVEHLKSFQQEDDSFSTLPPPVSKPRSEDKDISIGSTCTALMALIATRTHEQLWSKKHGAPDKTLVNIGELFEEVVKAKWQTSGLPDGNAFTTALVVRTGGFIAQGRIPTPVPIVSMTHRRYRYKNEKDGKFEVDETVAGKNLKTIIESKAKAKDVHKEPLFGVSGYPSKTTIAYWFLDGAINARVDLGDSLKEIAVWARDKFHDQLIYVSARNDSLMDPPELGMALFSAR